MTSLPQGIVKIADGVYQAQGEFIVLTPEYKQFLLHDSSNNYKKRSRINFHPSPASQVQEMVIALDRNTCLDVHQHFNKSESFHVIEGTLIVVLFDSRGSIMEEITLSSLGPNPFYRLDSAIDHLVIPVSKNVLMHETTCGPFVQGDCRVPEWSLTRKAQDRIESIREFHRNRFEFT